MRKHKFEPLSKELSVIGMGTMIFHPDTKERDFSLLDAFVDRGGTLVDTAEVYGAVEEYGYAEMVIGEWLAANPAMRDKIVLLSKGLIPGYCAPLHEGGAVISPASVRSAIDGSLKRLRTDYLDIWLFHRDDTSLPVGPLVDVLNEEMSSGRIRAFGASNWTTARIGEANEYARANGLAGMICSSPNFSLARANEPYWPDTVSVGKSERDWHASNNFPLIAWSALGRGFFALADPADKSDADLVRVYYSDENFARKKRAEEFAAHRGLSMFEVALAYVVSQDFPVVALNGARSVAEVENSLRAGELRLSDGERNWLDLGTDERPF